MAEGAFVAPNILEVTGIQSCNIRRTHYKFPVNHLEILESWRKQQIPERSLRSTPESQRALRIFCITLRANRLSDRWPRRRLQSLSEWTNTFLDVLQGLRGDEDQSLICKPGMADCLRRIRGRTVFETEKGAIGLGPLSTKPGDVVFELLGCSSPMVLRPSLAEPSKFTVVGECYVYGLEDAAALLGTLPQEWKVQCHIHKESRQAYRVYLNKISGDVIEDDPRLPPLPAYWTALWLKGIRGFKNTQERKTTYFDLRMSPEALQARGVKLQRFALI